MKDALSDNLHWINIVKLNEPDVVCEMIANVPF